ncbi:radical SAM protein [Dictyoglomus thermophilum]|uniref:Radical SAM n=1 Tax=Dictyoglomus thermophilum (strain ATCC 35947 / DSM 3960 / H-6-12) TaxID=309799 RepID=B5YEK7_DICT6|nr:radical SAM protein [Dictyoglomus thermophilum]ACI20000.1 radical SAM [Dictyoglomus thermophilum H-6-12]
MNWNIKKEIISLREKEKGFKLTKKGGDISILLIYPNKYSVSLNNLGYIGIYEIFNRCKGVICERAYIPEDWKKRKDFRVYSIESFKSPSEFDVLAFSVSFELDFLNVIYILKNENIPLFSYERDDSYPLIVGGGIALSANPESLADVFDILFIGEGEELVREFSDFLILKKEKGLTKREFFELLKDIEGIYIPSIDQKLPIKRRIYLNFENDPMVSPIISENAVFSNMALCELVRGCRYQCRFCLAGYFYRPYRSSSMEIINKKLRNFYDFMPRIGIIVPAVDPSLNLKDFVNNSDNEELVFSFSSLRLEDINQDLLDLIKRSGQKTVTIAPEAGTDRLRRVLNKGFTNEDILNFVDKLKGYGVQTLKLYFMLGLPTESGEDIEGIYSLIKEIRSLNPKLEITASFSTFIPKPHTPFQWESMKDKDYIVEKQRFLLKKLREIKKVKIEMEDYFWSFWQGVFSRGDRNLNTLWREVYENKEISVKILNKILRNNKDLLLGYLKEKGRSDKLSWDVIDTGVKRDYLWRERERAYEGKLTMACSKNCKVCGVCI